MHRDSVEKVIDIYFRAVATQPFQYRKGRKVVESSPPAVLYVSPHIFRGFNCPEGCGACCRPFTLDFLPAEVEAMEEADNYLVGELTRRMVPFNGSEYPIWSLMQDYDQAYYCTMVNPDNGRCGIHGYQPFSCDFELLRFLWMESSDAFRLTHKLFGRGWSYTRVDGQRGAMCSMIETAAVEWDVSWVADAVRKMRRLQDWTNHFELETHIDRIVEWLESGPHGTQLVLRRTRQRSILRE